MHLNRSAAFATKLAATYVLFSAAALGAASGLANLAITRSQNAASSRIESDFVTAKAILGARPLSQALVQIQNLNFGASVADTCMTFSTGTKTFNGDRVETITVLDREATNRCMDDNAKDASLDLAMRFKELSLAQKAIFSSGGVGILFVVAFVASRRAKRRENSATLSLQ